MSAEEDMRRIGGNVTAMTEDVFAQFVVEVHRSIVFGSELTGAPGQPVDTGNLRNSWEYEFDSPSHAFVTTPVEYGQAVEDGIGPHGPVVYGAGGGGRSTTGGSHSVILTEAAAQRIADVVTARVAGNRGTVIDGSTGFSGEDGG
jgi:hypothetical protein